MAPKLADRNHSNASKEQNSQPLVIRDTLAEIDEVLDGWSARRRAFRRQQVEADEERREFIRHAEGLALTVIGPALQAIADRLAACGGDGEVVQRTSDPFHSLRFTLWMALDGKVEVLDRPDRYPYIQLDLDVGRRMFTVWEGDVWERQGASRSATPLGLHDISTSILTERVMAILRRAAAHDIVS